MLFRPTYLYIKQHTITGKLYFGKTVNHPRKYKGSGVYWRDHIRKHGEEHVVTIWYELFDDLFECVAFAVSFSNKMNIVESSLWANLTEEKGIDGNGIRGPKTEIHKQHLRKPKSEIGKENMRKAALTRNNHTENKIKSFQEHSERMTGAGNPMFGKHHSEETKEKNRNNKPPGWRENIKKSQQNKPVYSCPHCGKAATKANLARWHNDNCKFKPS